MTYTTRPGAHPSIRINVLNYLPKARYIEALKRFMSAIEKGRPLTYYDDDSVGSKSMGCSWGLCSEDPKDWPDAEDHTFPVDFEKYQRVSTLPTRNLLCPLDTRLGPQSTSVTSSGCFYSCSVFQAKWQLPRRQDALTEYDRYIRILTNSEKR